MVPQKKGGVQAYWLDDARVISGAAHVVYTAFAHPRVLIDHFDETQKVLALCLRKAGWRKHMALATFIIHIRDEWQGGISDLEQRALVEVAKQLGANNTMLVNSARDLSAPEVLQIARGSSPMVRNRSAVVDVP